MKNDREADIDRRINSLVEEYKPFFRISSFDNTKDEGLVTSERYFADIIRLTKEALPFMNQEGRERYITKVSTHLSDFIGNELYIGSREEVQLKRLQDYTAMMCQVLALNEDSLNGHKERVAYNLHSRNVALLASSLARAAADAGLGINSHDIDVIEASGRLHDIGKMVVPIEILSKDGTLTYEETVRMRKHVEKSAELIRNAGFEEPAAYAGGHHIRFDGAGYPDFPENFGVDQNDIRFHILPYADMFEAVTRRRFTHKPPRTPEEAMALAREESGKQLHPELVKVAEETNCLVDTFLKYSSPS